MMSISKTLVRYGVPERYADKVIRRIGYGTEGAVYELPRDRILKVNVMASRAHSISEIYRKIKGKAWAARMGPHGALRGRGFWYVAPKLKPLPPRLITLLDDVGFMYLRYRRRGISYATFERYYKEKLDKMPPELAKTVRAGRRAGYRDIHGVNIMMTKGGKYKFIDVESIVRGRR